MLPTTSFSRLLPRRLARAGAGRILGTRGLQSSSAESYYDEEQLAMQKTARHIIDTEINPHVDAWEETGQYPAKQIFNKGEMPHRMALQ